MQHNGLARLYIFFIYYINVSIVNIVIINLELGVVEVFGVHESIL